MGGLPIFQYYFVPPYFLMVLLSPLLCLEIAFKIVSAAWIFFTPIAFYYGAKGLGFKKPGPEIAAAFSLALTWLETVTGGNYAQWGGNVKSAMAGQFPYGISLAFAVMCLGMLWNAYNTKKGIILNAIVFSMVILHHLYTAIVVGLAATFFLLHALKNRKFDGVLHLGKIFLLGVMIAGFWIIPSFAKLGWSSPPRDVFYGLPSMDWVFIQEYSVFYIIIILGFSISLIQHFQKKGLKNVILIYLTDLALTVFLVHMINEFFFKHESYSFYLCVTGLLLTLQVAFLSKESELLYCLYTFAFTFFMLYASQFTNLLYARFIPMLFAIYIILSTRAILNLINWLTAKYLVSLIITLLLVMWLSFGVNDILDLVSNSKTLSLSEGYPDLPAIATSFKSGNKNQWYVSHGIRDAPGWLRWNYEGLQVKSAWPGVRDMWNYTANLPLKGRINYEYYDYGKLATARIFEASPAFTNRSVMESLLVESSLTFPFFYYMQKTVSETSWWPGFPIKIPNVIDLKHGKDIYWVYNVQYYLVYSNTIKNLIKNETDYHYLTTVGTASSGFFDIYSVNEDSHYADVPRQEPILVLTDYWRPFSFKWFDVTNLSVPVAFKSEVDEYDLDHFRIIVMNKTINFEKRPGTVVYTSDQFLEAVNASKEIDYKSCSISESMSEELLLVNNSCVGKPLWIKIPYYPNWRTYDADRIYFVSPSLMLIFPNKEQVTLYYAWLPSDIIGMLTTITALIIITYAILLSNKTFRKEVQERLLSALSKIPLLKKLLNTLPKLEGRLQVFINNTIKVIERNKLRIILLVVLLWVFSSTLNYRTQVSLCSNACTAQGYPGYSIPAFGNVIDNYDMGYSNEKENNLRDLRCTAVCDPSRKEYVYVSGGGYVEFSMRVKPNAENILSIRAIDNQNCRQDDVYMDGQYIGQIYGIGEIGQRTNFELLLPNTSKSLVRIRIYHNTSKTDCYGFDVFSNQIKIPECSCLNALSSEQNTEEISRNIIGALAFIAVLVIVLSTLYRPLEVKIKTSSLYKIQDRFTSLVKDKTSRLSNTVRKNKKLVVLAIVALILLYFAVQYASRYLEAQSICTMECQDKGFKKGYAPSKTVIDELKLGADNAGEYPSHNFVCTAVCDETRKNYVYASGGAYIEFDMAVEPDIQNTLVIKSGNFNELCRQNDIYVDGQYVGEIIKPANESGEDKYEIKLPKTGESKIRVKIDHSTAKTQCWGYDIFNVKTTVPRCICE